MNQLLYGSNPEENIIAVHPATEHSMRIFVRNPDGIATKEVDFYPFFFLSNSKYLKNYPKRYWIKELGGNNYYRFLCAFSGWIDMWDAIRFVLERYNENAPVKADNYNELPVLHVRTDPVAQFLKQSGRTLFKGSDFTELHRVQVSIETVIKHGFKSGNPRRLEDRIIVIGLSDNRGWEDVIHGKRKNEFEMLNEFVKIIREKDPDVIEGHDIFHSGLPYIANRCEMHGVDMEIGRNGSASHLAGPRQLYGERALDYASYEIPGRHLIDTFLLLQAYDSAKRIFDNYHLKYAAEHFGFLRKERIYFSPEKASWQWEHDPEKVIRHALDNVQDIRALSDRLSPDLFYLTRLLPFNYSTVARVSAAAKLESLILREYIRQKHSIPKPEIFTQSTDTYSEIFYKGIFGPVIELDIEPLYNSVIMNENIRPSADELGIFPSLSRELFIESKEKKDHQSPMKTLVNSFHRYLGNNRALFGDLNAFESVAKSGRRILGELIASITQLNGKVTAVEDDSLYFVPPPSSLGEAHEMEFLNEIKNLFRYDIDFPIIGRYRKILILKRKFIALSGNDGKIKIRGTSLRTRSTERFGRIFMQKCIAALLDDNIRKAHDLYVYYHKSISSHKLEIKDYVRSESLRESMDDYIRAVDDKIRNRSTGYEVAIRSGVTWKIGDHISYYFTGGDSNVRGYENCKMEDDWDPNFPDENVQYYLKRLNEFAKKFEELFTEQDFRSVFSIEDLFGFSNENIKVIASPVKEESTLPAEDETEKIQIEPKIWLDEDSSI